MTSPVNTYARNSGAAFFYSDKWQQVVEDHRQWLFEKAIAETPIEVTPHLAHRFQNDLYGLLMHENYSLFMHWVILRVNDFTSPVEFDNNRTVLYVPPESAIERLRQIAVTTYN